MALPQPLPSSRQPGPRRRSRASPSCPASFAAIDLVASDLALKHSPDVSVSERNVGQGRGGLP